MTRRESERWIRRSGARLFRHSAWCAAALLGATLAPPLASAELAAPAPYEVHEWGVFVNGQVRTHNPPLSSQTAPALPTEGGAPRIHAPTITVDKPVLYFHGETPLEVQAHVDFSQGRPREVWPPTPLNGTLSWQLELTPGGCEAAPPYPPVHDCQQIPASVDQPPVDLPPRDVDGDDGTMDGLPAVDGPALPFYCEASELSLYEVPGAMCVRTATHRAPLLFYAGALPQESMDALEVSIGLEGNCWMSVEVTNRSSTAVHDVFVLIHDPRGDGSHAEARVVDRLGPGETRGWCTGHEETTAEQAMTQARRDFHARLQRRGLTAAESAALGVAWDETFFGLTPPSREASRRPGRNVSVVYTLDEATYDALLPLTLSPAPQRRARVGVVYQPDASSGAR